MADEPKTDAPQTPSKPEERTTETDPRADARNESTKDAPPEVIDDDRFQATDN
jgi:hypothetical protein